MEYEVVLTIGEYTFRSAEAYELEKAHGVAHTIETRLPHTLEMDVTSVKEPEIKRYCD